MRAALAALIALGCGSCRQYVDMTPPGRASDTFGNVMFEVVCERVGYSHEVDVKAQDPQARTDVAGVKYRAACTTPTPAGALPAETDAPKVNVLVARRPDVVTALDLILPPELLDPVNKLLQAVLPLYDDGTFSRMNGATGALLRAFAGDDELTAALARLAGRDGYRPLEAALGLTRQIFDYPEIDTVLKSVLGTLDDGGAAHEPFLALTRALHLELLTAQPVAAPRDPERTINLALPVLFAEDAQRRFAAGTPRLLVRRDFRGVAGLAGSTGVPAPFVDRNGDGLPDVDGAGRFVGADGAAIASYWPFPTKDGAGAAPRDAQGRLLASNGQPVYDYVDLDNTLIAGAVRDSLKLFDVDQDTVLALIRGAASLLGPRGTVAKPYTLPDGTTTTLTYSGFDPSQAPLLELVYGLLQVLGAPNMDATLDGTNRLLAQHENIVAWLVGTALNIKEFAKRPEFAGAAFPEGSTVIDDLIPLLRRLLANQALVADLMDALKDPITQNLGRIHSYYMTYRDRWDPDPNDLNGPPIGGFTHKVDRAAPDSGLNRSLNHRLFHLVHDTNGAVLCSKAGATVEVLGIGVATYDTACDLFKIDNLGKFYVQSMARVWDSEVNAYVPKAKFPMNLKFPLTLASRSMMDSVLESESGITGFKTHPSTEALNRVIFADPTPAFLTSLQDDPRCVDGDKIKDAHPGTIIAWEVKARDLSFSPYTNASYDPNESLFYQSLRPVVQAFADHDEEGLFLDLVSVLYHHWGTTQSTDCQFTNPTAKRYCFGDGGVRYEPLLAAIMDPLSVSTYPTVPPQTFDLMRVLTASAPVLAGLTLSDGRPARPEILQTASWLVSPQAGLTYRDGTARVNYKRLVPRDGVDTYDVGSENVSALELLADGFAAKRQALATAGDAGEEWKRSTSTLVDLFLEVSPDGQRFTNPRLPAMGAAVIPFLRGRLAHHQAAGDLTQWLRHGLMQDVEDGLTSPILAGLVDFADALKIDDEARRALYGLLRYLLDESQHRDAFQVALTALADVVQLLVDDVDLTPILRAAGRALDPELGAAQKGISFLARARALDEDLLLSQILRHLWQKYGGGETPFGTIADVAGEVHRVEPGRGGPLDAADYRELLAQAADFMDDNDRGLQRFIDVVCNRTVKR
ncbi:MAG TPA: hypothetical protein VGQ83_01645 [Polyangia bacterium]|jgi:hypothetical protein